MVYLGGWVLDRTRYGQPFVTKKTSPEDPSCTLIHEESGQVQQNPLPRKSYQTKMIDVEFPKIDIQTGKDRLSTMAMHNGSTTMIDSNRVPIPLVVHT